MEEEIKPMPDIMPIFIGILVVLLITLGVAISYFPLPSEAPDDTAKIIVGNQALQHMLYLTEGDVEGYLGGLYDGTIDLGGGSQGDGSMDLDAMRQSLEAFFQTNNYLDNIHGIALSELFDLENMLVLDYQEIMSNDDYQWETFGYTIQGGDYLVWLPPTDGSLMFDGFFAYYRYIDGSWKIVATD